MISKFRILIFWLLVPFLPLSGCGGGSNTAPPASPLVGINVSPNTTITTNEYSQTATVSISLGSIPAADVTIPVSSSDTTEGTVDKTSLVFTKTDWSTPQTITITGVNDTIADGDQSYLILLGPAISASSTYNSMEKSIPTVNLDVVDGSFVVSASSVNTSESGTTATSPFVLAPLRLPMSRFRLKAPIPQKAPSTRAACSLPLQTGARTRPLP